MRAGAQLRSQGGRKCPPHERDTGSRIRGRRQLSFQDMGQGGGPGSMTIIVQVAVASVHTEPVQWSEISRADDVRDRG